MVIASRRSKRKAFLRRSLAPLWGLAVGVASLFIYWPGIVGELAGLPEFSNLRPLRLIDLRTGDALHKLFAAKEPPANTARVCVVGVTAEDIARYGPMPWPRRYHAELIRRLNRLGAGVIAFDIFFPDATPDDAALIEACRTSGNVILPRWGVFPEMTPVTQTGAGGESSGETTQWDDRRPIRFSDGVFRRTMREAADDIYAAASSQGHINVFYDEDLVARRVPVAVGPLIGKDAYLPLGLVAAMASQGVHPQEARIERDALVYGGVRIPLDESACVLINYHSFKNWIDNRPLALREIESNVKWLASDRRHAPIEFFDYADVIEGRVPPESFRDAVVLVGQCVSGSREDVHVTPEGSQFGVFVQAMLVHAGLAHQFLDPLGAWRTAGAILCLSVMFGIIFFRLRYGGSAYTLMAGGGLVMALGGVGMLCAIGMLRRQGIVVDASPFLLTLGLNLLGGVAANTARLAREAERRSREVDLLLQAAQRQACDWETEAAPHASAIPGADHIAASTSIVTRSRQVVADTFWRTVPCQGCILFIPGEAGTRSWLDRVPVGVALGDFSEATHEGLQGLAREVANIGHICAAAPHDHNWPFDRAASQVGSLLAAPIFSRGELLGVALLINRRHGSDVRVQEFSDDDVRLAEGLRHQSGVLLENARQYRREQKMFEGFAASMAKAVDVRDGYTHGHSSRVAEFAEGIARELGLSDAEQGAVQRAAMLHDLGKIGVSDAVLNKPGSLTYDEIQLIRSHAVKGYEILRNAPSFEVLLPGIRHHHEWYNGAGYPDGLAGESIPLMARIIAVADCYDAMTSQRVYRRALPAEQARQELIRCAGAQFDPKVVDAFLRYWDRRLSTSHPLVLSADPMSIHS